MEKGRSRSKLRSVAPALAIMASAAVVVSAHVAAYRPLSPFDEGVHFDYAYKVARGELVHKGETIGQVAMREMSCRSVDLTGLVLPPCMQGTYSPQDFPNRGYNSADIHTPLYYAASGLVGRVLHSTGIVESPVTATRLPGILWFGLGLLTVWYLGKEAGVATGPLAVVVTLVAVSPPLVHATATVNNDATALAAGGVLGLLTLRWERGAAPLWLLGLAALVGVTLKSTNIIAVVLCAIYLLLRRGRGVEEDRKSPWPAIAVLMGSAAAAVLAWTAIHGAMAEPVVTPLDRRFEAAGLGLVDFLGPITSLVSPVSYGLPTREVLAGATFGAVGGVLGALMIAASIFPLMRGSLSERREHLSASAGLTILTGGFLFTLGYLLLLGEAIGVSPRYGFSLMPALAVAVAAALTSRWAVRGLAAFAVGHVILVLGTLVAP